MEKTRGPKKANKYHAVMESVLGEICFQVNLALIMFIDDCGMVSCALTCKRSF